MSIFVVLEFTDIVGVVAVVRAVVHVQGEYRANIWVIIVCFGLFLTHLHPFAALWSVVVPE